MKKFPYLFWFITAIFIALTTTTPAHALPWFGDEARAKQAAAEKAAQDAEAAKKKAEADKAEADKKAAECSATLASTTAERDAARVNCPPTAAPKAVAPVAATPTVHHTPALPRVCVPDAKLVNGECTCSDVAIQPHWKGDQPGVIVKVQRQSVLQKIDHGREVYACVATRDSVTALLDEFLRRYRLECDVKATVDAFDAPPEESQKLYPSSVDDGDPLTYDTRECSTLKAYLHNLVSWKHDLETAGPDKEGNPAPFTVNNWLIVWNRTLELADQVGELAKQVGNHETRIKALENSRVDIDFEAGLRGGYYFREKTHGSGALAFDAMFTLWKGDAGAYVGGTGGWAFNQDQKRMIADMRLGFAWGGFCDLKNGEHPCVLRLGGAAHSEPILRYTNDVFGIAGELGFDFRPGGGIFGIGAALQVGGDRAAMYKPPVRMISGTELYVAPTLWVGLFPL